MSKYLVLNTNNYKLLITTYSRFLPIHFPFAIPDLGQIDKVLEEFDTVFVPNLTPGNFFPLLDASSLLWRMNVSISGLVLCVVVNFPLAQVMGMDPGEERWRKVMDNFKPHLNNPTLFSWSESTCYSMYTMHAHHNG